ncbi:MAG: response regulator [Gammaproteobacteria bacterium]|nr:response regulator [Gammaproteobacteria bacterium]
MGESGDLQREVRALRDRVAALTAAVLRVSDSLDLATVLQEVVDSARALTAARYGVICTVDAAGDVRDFVTSGFTAEEKRRFAEWPDGPRLFAHLRDQPGPLRIADLPDYVHERGFSPELMRSKTLQSMPMSHRGVPVGNFFLAEKEDAAVFTAEDEETLGLFAAQAATAIANARAFTGEERARADLELLIETSPVGVAVLDAKTGRLATFNHEARRLVEALRTGDEDLAAVLETLTCRFADGRELDLAELPIGGVLAAAEEMRAEEVVVSVPDGRSVRMLINVSPNRGADGEVASVVATMQDLAPLEELERLRSEFVSMVSHELRAPLAAIKGSAAAVLGSARAVSRTEMRQFFRIVDAQADHMQGLIGDLLDAGRMEAGTLSVDPEPSDLAALVEAARSTFTGGGARHAVRVDLPPDLPRVMADPERIAQVLVNLLANAARNGPATSPIVVEAERDGAANVEVSVVDRGKGVSAEMLPLLFRKHVTLAGGEPGAATGLGLAICKGLVEAHGGRIRAESAGPGQGARFAFTLPVAPGADAQLASAPVLHGARPDERTRVLVVDDDPNTLRYVRSALADAGYAPVVTADPSEVGALVRSQRPRLVLLDLALPGTDGIELMRTVPELADLPVIFISGYGRDETVALALDSGAADYIVKPFSPTELEARVAAALRLRAEPESFVLGDLSMDYARRRVTVANREVALTPTEYELLRLLSLNAGRVVTSDALLRQAWGGRDPGDAQPVRSFVRKLRAKLGDDAGRPAYIFNVRGVGYRMPNPLEG